MVCIWDMATSWGTSDLLNMDYIDEAPRILDIWGIGMPVQRHKAVGHGGMMALRLVVDVVGGMPREKYCTHLLSK